MARRPKSPISIALLVVFATFIVLGMPDGVVGTVWPTQRSDLGLAVGDLSWVITGLTIGYTSGSIVSGHVTHRWGTGSGMVAALAISFSGLIGFGLAPNLPALVVVGVVAGCGAGLLDPIVNAWVSLRYSARAMGFLHAFFGLGAAIGAPFAAAALDRGSSWRTVFVVLGLAELALLLVVWLRRHDFDAALPHQPEPDHPDEHPAGRNLLRMTLVWFFLIVGLEVSVGSWSFSLLVEERGVTEGSAALWVASFWGAFTLGRVAMGLAGERLALERALWGSVLLTALGAGVMWADLTVVPAGSGLPVLGLGISLLFPVMVLITPGWLGANRASTATGYQFGAAAVGAVVFSIAIGGLADAISLEVLGPFLFLAAIATGILLGAMRSAARRVTRPPYEAAAVSD